VRRGPQIGHLRELEPARDDETGDSDEPSGYAAAALARSLATARSAETGTVRISTSAVAATWLLPPVIAALREAEPGIAIELVSTKQITNLLRREADIAVRMVRLVQLELIGYDRDDSIERGFARLGLALPRDRFAVRTDDQVAYTDWSPPAPASDSWRAKSIRHWPGVVALLPELEIPPLPYWLAVHREIRSNRLVRRVYDFLADALPAELAG
jgi:DNA-binding transcriptional LysR family regulator